MFDCYLYASRHLCSVHGCRSAAVGEPATKDSQMSVDLVVGGNENVSNTVVVETTQMQSLTATNRYCAQP